MEDLVAEKRIKTVVSLLAKNEKLRRLYLAAEAESLGWGGMVYVSKIAGVDKDTVTAGKKDLEKLRQNHETQCSDSIDDSESPIKERIRAEGGGRKSIVDTQPGIIEALLKLIDGSEYGNPENPLSYTSKSTRHLATELTKQGFTVSHTKIKELLEEQGYRLQGNRKLKQVGKDHEDRNEQFEHIKRTSMEYMSAGEPVISIDCKKKNNLGDFANKGVEYRKVKDPKALLDHDFFDPENGKAIPYGTYDVANNEGYVNRNSRHLILTTRVLVLCTVLLYSTHSLQFVFTRSVLYCGWTLHFKLRIYFVHLFYRLRGQQVFRKYLNNLILEY